jgi:hypothetical protein
LHIHPELRGSAEKRGQPQSRVRRDGSALQCDVVDARARQMNLPGELVNADAHGLEELFAKDLAWMDIPSPLCLYWVSFLADMTFLLVSRPSMIIDDFNLVRIPSPPDKTDTISPIDANLGISQSDGELLGRDIHGKICGVQREC